MQSMNIPFLSSLGARRTKHGLGRRFTWAMGVLAVLLAVLAVAVSPQQSASAQTSPDGTVTITVDENSIDYETATATITVTDGDTLFDRLDADHTENWYVSVKHTIKGANDYSEAQQGGPGAPDPDFVFGEPDTNGVVTATVKLDKWTDGNPDDQVLINSLVPGSTYVVEAVLAFDNPNYRTADRATDEFNTEGVCAPYTGAKDKREWHSRSGLRIDDHKITRTSMVVAVNVPWDIAPMNSGRCLYYTMTGGGSTVEGSAFVYNQGSGARIGWIIATGLKSGTHYDFTIGLAKDLSGFNSGIGARTLGPRLTISVEDIEQTEATVTVAIPPDEGDTGERTIHLAYYKADDKYAPDLDDKKVTLTPKDTVSRSTSFDLETLSPGTAYWVDVSMIAGFPTYETKSEPFTTKAPNPSIGTVTVDLNSITQTEATATVSIDHPNDEEQTIFLQYQTVPNGGWNTLALTDKTTLGSKDILIAGLTGNTEYEVQAWLQTDVNNKVKSLPFTTSPVVPEAPDITSVTHGDGELTVTWTAPTGQGSNGGADIEYFVVQWKPNTVSDWASPLVQEGSTIDETVLTYPITGLSNGTTYDIRVRADNGVVPEAGQDYNWDEHFGTPDVLPDKPTIQSVVEGHTQLAVTWDEPANTGSDITGYVVQWKDNSVSGWDSPLGSETLEETDFTHTITSLANGTEYAVRVRAVNGLVLPVEDEDDYNWSDEEPGTPRPEPIVTGVTVADATITRTERDGDGYHRKPRLPTSQTVHLQYRKTTSSRMDACPRRRMSLRLRQARPSTLSRPDRVIRNYVVEAWLATTSTIEGVRETFKTGPVEPDAPRNVAIIGSADEEITVAWDPPSGKRRFRHHRLQGAVERRNNPELGLAIRGIGRCVTLHHRGSDKRDEI